MNKCLNCGKIIDERSEVCSQECAKEYFEYVYDEKLEDHPEFTTKIAGVKNSKEEVKEIEERIRKNLNKVEGFEFTGDIKLKLDLISFQI